MTIRDKSENKKFSDESRISIRDKVAEAIFTTLDIVMSEGETTIVAIADKVTDDALRVVAEWLGSGDAHAIIAENIGKCSAVNSAASMACVAIANKLKEVSVPDSQSGIRVESNSTLEPAVPQTKPLESKGQGA